MLYDAAAPSREGSVAGHASLQSIEEDFRILRDRVLRGGGNTRDQQHDEVSVSLDADERRDSVEAATWLQTENLRLRGELVTLGTKVRSQELQIEDLRRERDFWRGSHPRLAAMEQQEGVLRRDVAAERVIADEAVRRLDRHLRLNARAERNSGGSGGGEAPSPLKQRADTILHY